MKTWDFLFCTTLKLEIPNKKLKKGIISGFLIGLLLIGFLLSGEIFGYAKPEN